MIGSSYPDSADLLSIAHGTPWCSSMLREVAAMLLATQRTIGPRVGNLGELGIIGVTDWKTAFRRRAILEVGSFTASGTPHASQVVTFTDPLKFTAAPRVFIIPRTAAGTAQQLQTYVDPASISTTQFTAYPHYASATTVHYLAVGSEWDS